MVAEPNLVLLSVEAVLGIWYKIGNVQVQSLQSVKHVIRKHVKIIHGISDLGDHVSTINKHELLSAKIATTRLFLMDTVVVQNQLQHKAVQVGPMIGR